MSTSFPPTALTFAAVEMTVELIASELKSAADTATDTPPSEGLEQDLDVIEKFGGDDGARTRDLRRDRPAF